MGMYDAMFREYFEKEDQVYRYNVTTTAQRIVLISSVILSSILLIFNKPFSYLFFGTDNYGDIVLFAAIAFFLSANVNLIQAPTRIQNKRKVFVASGLLSSVCTYALSVILLYLGYSYFGLIYSNIIAAIIMLLFFWILNRKFFTKGEFDKKIAKELFKIGLPLLPTFLIYWIYNSMDRIMITNMLGTSELGIFAIGSRVAQISLFIYMAFAGGWQYFAFSTMKDDDQVRLNSNVFEYLGAISFLSFIVIYPFNKTIFTMMFSGDYVLGYIVFPYLYLAPLLLMLFQVVGNQFLVIKKTSWVTISLSVGAIINIVLNLMLIKYIGVEGAAISTLIGYIVTLVIVSIVTIRMKLLILSNRFIIVSIVTVSYTLLNRLFFFGSFLIQLIIAIILIVVFVYLYKEELSKAAKKIMKKNKPQEN